MAEENRLQSCAMDRSGCSWARQTFGAWSLAMPKSPGHCQLVEHRATT